MDEQEEVQQNNMISNLPLLFANGYPTALNKITERQLENFIPFMVQCSLGHINVQDSVECTEPEWWPEDISFSIPFTKPKKYCGNWLQKMKEIVRICYHFHKSVFLLRFCTDLASYEQASLRFINNYNSTTSLFDRRSNKLLVTFRNENMSYDQPQRNRKCLLQPKVKNSRQIELEAEQMMVQPAPFDIYLCDNCDAELYSEEAIFEHEKTCNIEDDDVILCDSPSPSESHHKSNELHLGFMQMLNLKPLMENRNLPIPQQKTNKSGNTFNKDENSCKIAEKNRRLPRRNRSVHSLTRCPTIPLSSPAGQVLLRTSKTVMSAEYLAERLDRVERFCHAPSLSKNMYRPKYFDKRNCTNNHHCTFKKPQDYTIRTYTFPRRQFARHHRGKNFLLLNSTLIKRCRPVSIRLKKMTDQEIIVRKNNQHSKLNIKLTRDTSQSSSSWKITSPSTEVIVDTIDLCSSEEEDCNTNHTSKLDSKDADKPYTKVVASVGNCEKSVTKSKHNPIPNNKNYQQNRVVIDEDTVCNPHTIKSRLLSVNGSILEKTNIQSLCTTTVTVDASSKQAKPLRPSVFIFSNYTSTTSSMNEIVTENERIQNQENHLIANAEINNSVKASANTSLSIPSIEWCQVGTTTNNNNNSSSNNLTSEVNSAYSSDQELSNTNLGLIHHQSFGSPARIVSIDLTS